jgi:hypothetical protein
MGIGAGIMYLLDPNSRGRRLAFIRDQFVSGGTKLSRFGRGRVEDLKNRAYGLYCEARSLVGSPCESEHTRLRRVG